MKGGYEEHTVALNKTYYDSLTHKQKLLHNLPKARSGLQIFMYLHSKRIYAENPEAKGNGQKFVAIEWNNLGSEGQQHYKDIGSGEKERYKQALELNGAGMARKGYHFKNSWMIFSEER